MLFIFVGIGLTAWETMARLTRGQVFSVREKEFIEAAHTIGAGNLRIMFRHILPNILGPLIVNETLAIPGYIWHRGFSILHRAWSEPADPVLGSNDLGWRTRDPHLSEPGHLPGSGAGDHDVRLQFPGRRTARRI